MVSVEKMFKKNSKGIVLMLIFLLVASFSAPLLFHTQALIELPHARLTGTISDAGVDLDGSGKFDYLVIGVGVNVSVASEYIVTISGLSADLLYSYISVSDMKREYLSPGIHTVNIYLYGPVIYQSGQNPTKVSSISLQSVRYEFFMPIIESLDSRSSVPLSRKYNYTEFDASFSDIEAMFTVYPNGSVALSGALNYTHMIPFNPGPEVYGTAGITRNGDLTEASANCTFVVPPDIASRFPVELPINTTEVSYQEQYSGTQFSTDLSVNMTLPRWLASAYPFNTTDFSMLGTYSGGIGSMGMNFTTVVPESIRSMFPFNVTDVTITGKYMNEQLTGNITFHVISGFPIFDFTMDFEGTKTDLSLTGEVLVMYGDFPMVDIEINQTILEEMLLQLNSTIPGKEPSSLYNMTNGILECTHLNTTLTPYDGIGAWVDFDVGIHGDFIELLTYTMMQSLQSYYARLPPPETLEQMHDMIYAALNTTVNSVESVNFQIVYVHGTGEAEIRMTFVDNVLYLIRGLAEIAAKVNATALSPYITDTLASAPLYSIIYTIISLNATLPYLSEAQTQLTYSRTTGKLQLRATSSGEIDPEEYYNLTYPMPEEMPPELRELFEALQKARFCNITSYNQSFTYRDSVGNLRMEYTLEGDLNAQANFVKSLMVSYMNLTSPQQVTWKALFLNQTVIDVVNLQMNFNVRNTSASGELTGIMLLPPIDLVDPTRFKLERFFNLTSEMPPTASEPPTTGQRLKITVKGGSNATHAVTLHRPETVPIPDEVSTDMTLMVWNNQSLSGIKDLVFIVAREITFTVGGVPYDVRMDTNSTITSAAIHYVPSPKMSFDVEGPPGTTGFCNVSIPKVFLNASLNEWVVRVDGIEVTANITESPTHTFLFFTYSHSKKTIEIIGTYLVPEFPQVIILVLIMLFSLVTALLRRKVHGDQRPKNTTLFQ